MTKIVPRFDQIKFCEEAERSPALVTIASITPIENAVLTIENCLASERGL